MHISVVGYDYASFNLKFRSACTVRVHLQMFRLAERNENESPMPIGRCI